MTPLSFTGSKSLFPNQQEEEEEEEEEVKRRPLLDLSATAAGKNKGNVKTETSGVPQARTKEGEIAALTRHGN